MGFDPLRVEIKISRTETEHFQRNPVIRKKNPKRQRSFNKVRMCKILQFFNWVLKETLDHEVGKLQKLQLNLRGGGSTVRKFN